jgi:predicted protein tyrosine phosphatase
MKRILFICNQGEHRSKTAKELFKNKFQTECAGLFNNILKKEQLEKADLVVVMENFQREEIGKRFPAEYLKKKIILFDIPDYYSYNQPELINLLRKKENLLF